MKSLTHVITHRVWDQVYANKCLENEDRLREPVRENEEKKKALLEEE